MNPFPPGSAEYAAWARAEARSPAPRAVALPAAEPGVRHELPNPRAPLEVARALAGIMANTDGTPHLAAWRGDFYTYTGTHWEAIDKAAVTTWIYGQTEHAYYVELDDQKKWRPDRKLVDYVEHALRFGVVARSGNDDRLIAMRNGVLAIEGRILDDHHPDRFNLHSLPFAYDPDADCPTWKWFLESVLPDDPEAHGFLAEWFGYVISGDTRQQKMLSLVGPPRCGKGTISRIMTAVMGKESVANPTLTSLGGQFGEAGLIGKSLAIMSDVRWKRPGAAEAIDVLLAVIGEDNRSVNRKNRDEWQGQLGVRFVAMSNDIPTFTDSSGAMANRMMHIRLETSFLGREDIDLTAKLMEELPGILNWALDGLDRLRARGRFVPPASGRKVEEEVKLASSPYVEFAQGWCEPAPGHVESLDDLFAAWQQWCRDEGRREPGVKRSLSAGLQTSIAGISAGARRNRPDGGKESTLVGIKLIRQPKHWIG